MKQYIVLWSNDIFCDFTVSCEFRVGVSVTVRMWRLENNFQELVLFFSHVAFWWLNSGHRAWWQVSLLTELSSVQKHHLKTLPKVM